MEGSGDTSLVVMLCPGSMGSLTLAVAMDGNGPSTVRMAVPVIFQESLPGAARGSMALIAGMSR